MTEKLTAEQIRKNRRIVAITACVLAVAIPLLMSIYNQFLAPSPYELVCRDVNEHYPSQNPKRLIMEQDLCGGMTLVLYETHNKNVFDCQLVIRKLFKTEIRTRTSGGLLDPIFENDENYKISYTTRTTAKHYALPNSPQLLVGVTGTSPEHIFYGTEECEFIVDPETGSTFYWFFTEDEHIAVRAISFNEPSAYGIVKDKMVYNPEYPSYELNNRLEFDTFICQEIIDQNHTFFFYTTKQGLYAGVIVNKDGGPLIQTGTIGDGLFYRQYIGTNSGSNFSYVRNVYSIDDDHYFVAEITDKKPTSASLCEIPATIQSISPWGGLYLCYCTIPKTVYDNVAFTYNY